MIDRRLLAKIHVAKGQLHLSDEVYRDILRAQCGVASSTDLDVAGAEKLLAYFRGLGWKAAPRRRPHPNPLALPGPAQLTLLEGLYTQMGWTPERRTGFNRRTCGAPWPQTREQANRIIEALKAMKARGYIDRPTPKEGS